MGILAVGSPVVRRPVVGSPVVGSPEVAALLAVGHSHSLVVHSLLVKVGKVLISQSQELHCMEVEHQPLLNNGKLPKYQSDN